MSRLRHYLVGFGFDGESLAEGCCLDLSDPVCSVVCSLAVRVRLTAMQMRAICVVLFLDNLVQPRIHLATGFIKASLTGFRSPLSVSPV